MEQKLFTTMDIANELEHKSKNPNRDVRNIAKRLGFTPVGEQVRDGYQGGRPEKLWSQEQRDAILADNHNRHKKPAQIDSSDDKDTRTEQHIQTLPAVAIRDTCSGVLAVQTDPPVEPAEVEGKKIMPATTAATDQKTPSKFLDNDTKNHDVAQQFCNLPAEIISLPRWLPTRKDKPKAPLARKPKVFRRCGRY